MFKIINICCGSWKKGLSKASVNYHGFLKYFREARFTSDETNACQAKMVNRCSTNTFPHRQRFFNHAADLQQAMLADEYNLLRSERLKSKGNFETV